MCGFDGRVKVLDFGVAKMRDQRTVTLPGIVKGKPLYMSPEQATAERIDRRSDIFSMGLILYEALLARARVQSEGRHPDDGGDRQRRAAPAARACPRPLWEVMERALQKEPENRYRNALEMAQALREAAEPMREHEVASLLSSRLPPAGDRGAGLGEDQQHRVEGRGRAAQVTSPSPSLLWSLRLGASSASLQLRTPSVPLDRLRSGGEG